MTEQQETNQDVAVTLTQLTERIGAHTEAGSTRYNEIIRRLTLINGTIAEHNKTLQIHSAAIGVLNQRWVMLGWALGALAAGVSIATGIAALLWA